MGVHVRSSSGYSGEAGMGAQGTGEKTRAGARPVLPELAEAESWAGTAVDCGVGVL